MPIALIAEDELLIRELVTEDLTDAGFAVTAVNNAANALAALEDGAPVDLLFTDIQMPGPMDGWELGRKALAMRPEIKVIYSTGYSDRTDDLSSRERCITKPYRYDDVIALLKDLDLV